MHSDAALFLAPSLWLLLAAIAPAQTEIWVDANSGSDTNPGTHAMPLLSLTQAVQNAGPGDRIFLLPGVYGAATNESFPIALGAVPQQGLEIRGLGGVTIDMGLSTLPLFRMIQGADGCRVTNLTITNTDRQGWWTRVINSGSGVDSMDAANHVEIDRCRFVNINRGFVLWAMDNVQGWRIHDNLFHDCANDAILEYAGNNEVYNNTFVTGTWKAYISDSPTSQCYNNVVSNYAIAFENNNAQNNVTRYQNNWVWQCATVTQGAGLAAGLPPSNTVGQDPQFTNPTGADFHPAAGSPLIDAGDPGIFDRADLDEGSRVVDSDLDGTRLPDIGAYEATPVDLSVTWDPIGRLLLGSVGSSAPNAFVFVLFSFDAGRVPVAGHPTVLLDQSSLIPAWLTMAPGPFGLNLQTSPPFAPGQRLVMQALAFVPGLPSILPSNRVWTQL